jgi:hypothetical protein
LGVTLLKQAREPQTSLEIFGLKACMLCNAREHAWTKFLALMEGEHEVGPAFT